MKAFHITLNRAGDLEPSSLKPRYGNFLLFPNKRHLSDLLAQDFNGNAIRVADHCYGCTAGQGSSCGGALEA